MQKVVFVLVALMFMVQPVLADNVAEVDVFMKERLDGIMALLKNPNLSKENRNAKIIEIISEAFDFTTMAKLSLGKKHWTKLSKEDRRRFNTLFTKRLKTSYIEKFDLYEDEAIVYSKSVQVRKKIHLMTELVSGDNKITILYKLYKSKKAGWRVYDLELEGVSLIMTYRSQFNEVLAAGSMTDLFAKLERPAQ